MTFHYMICNMLFPPRNPQLCWTYLTALVARKPQPGGTLLLCACWFLLGFIAAHKFLSC